MQIITEFKDEWEALSNSALCSVYAMRLKFPSVENAFQAYKCIEPEDRRKFVNISPSEAIEIGNTFSCIQEWNTMKFMVMEFLILQKFSQKHFREILLRTKDAELQNGNNHSDYLWGICPPGSRKGDNMLGKLLMDIRSKINYPNY